MVLIKETSIAIIVSLLLYVFVTERHVAKHTVKTIAKYSVPLLVIALFFVLQKMTTGKYFCIYPFPFQLVKLEPEVITHKAVLVTKWLFLYQYRFVFTLFIIFSLLMPDRRPPEPSEPHA